MTKPERKSPKKGQKIAIHDGRETYAVGIVTGSCEVVVVWKDSRAEPDLYASIGSLRESLIGLHGDSYVVDEIKEDE